MSTADHDRLVEMMSNTLDRITGSLDALDALAEMNAGGYGTQDDWEALDDRVRDVLEDLGNAPDDDGDWDTDAAEDSVCEDLEPLSITWEKGEPFDVALTIGGPNIYLVDFGGHGGPQLRGYWGESHVITGPNVRRALDYYRERIDY